MWIYYQENKKHSAWKLKKDAEQCRKWGIQYGHSGCFIKFKTGEKAFNGHHFQQSKRMEGK